MSNSHLETLHLEATRVETASRFLESYAQMCLEERADVDARLERLAELHSASALYRESWNLEVEAASSLMDAGQWAMLTDPARALRLWRRAGRLYRATDFGFGYYLSAIAGAYHVVDTEVADDNDLSRELTRRLRDVAIYSHIADRELYKEARIDLPDPLRRPQQQAYLVLAASTLAGATKDSELRYFLSSLLEQSPHRSGVTPVGALSVPISTWWEIAALLMTRELRSLNRLARIMSDIARRYEESIQLAMMNQYLWRNAASPVDVGSFDIAALTISAVRAFDSVASIDEVDHELRRGIADANPLASGQVEMAIDLAREGRG
ncbi:MAG: hypothetical protein WB777_17085 [Mycobacterium sp.]